MTDKVLITSALPYANGPLHFGHIAGAYLPADCYARYLRMLGKDVLYICGSDEYGVAITLSAERAGKSPQEHVDMYHDVIHKFFKKLDISFDHFSRTTWPGHVATTQQFFNDLKEKGYIEERETDQLYSEQEGRFLADRYVEGTCPKCGFKEARGDECVACGSNYEATDLLDPHSKISRSPLLLKSTKHWFLRFDLFKEQLASWLASKKDWKSNVLNFARSYIEDLRPRAITRDSTWGVPLPITGSEGKVFYVWFDAPIGYISATKHWAELKGDPDAWKKYWLDPKTQLVQFIGKDNIPFHAIFFPAMIMGQNQPYKLVDQLPANEFYNLEGKQFSKSEGWYIDLESFFKVFTPDQIRYFIAATAPESQDAEFSWKEFQMRCNAELLGKYGNLVNRVLVFVASHCSKSVPLCGNLQDKDKEFLANLEKIAQDISEAYATFHLRKATQLIMEMAQIGNTYFDLKKPWVAAKKVDLEEMKTTLFCCLQCLKYLALVSYPVMPHSAEKIWSLLGYTSSLSSQKWADALKENVPAGQALPDPFLLFKRVEDEVIDQEITKLKQQTKKKEKSFSLKEEVTIEEVRKLDLRVARILAVEKVPDSKKLLKLTLDLGTEKRIVVSAIGNKMQDMTSLIDKKVVLVANLKKAKFMGVESQGMILSTIHENQVDLPILLHASPGDEVL